MSTEKDESVWVHLTEAVSPEQLCGHWETVASARGLIVFPHGRGTSREPSDIQIASRLRTARFSTLKIDLLTLEEADLDARTAAFRFDISLLARRLTVATHWLTQQPNGRGLGLGFFASGYNASVALVAAAETPDLVGAVVVHDVPQDLGGRNLGGLTSPTLLLGSAHRKTTLLPNVSERFVSRDDVETTSRIAIEWFSNHLAQRVA